jgi:hypothetical protein
MATITIVSRPEEQASTAYDILRSVGTGLRDAAEGTVGTAQDLTSLAGQGVGYLTGTKQDWDIPYVPSTDEVNQFTSQFVGPSYEPQTTWGKYARTGASFAPVMINPTGSMGKIAREIGTSVAGGLASEAAGQATEGSKYEPLARLAAGIGGSSYAGSIDKGVEGSITGPGRRAEAGVEDAAAQHGVRLTRGERTGNIDQQMAEQQMLHGGRGELAQRLMAGRRQENLSAIKESGEGFIDTAAPARGADPVQSGGLLNEQTRNRAEGLMDAGGQKIQGAIDEGVIVDAQRLRDMPGELEGKLTGADEFIPDVTLDANTPMASKAKGVIDKFVTKFNDPSVIEDSLSSVERLRRTIGNMQAVTPEDKRAMGKLMKSFDDWYDDVIANDATVAKTPPGVPSGRTPDDILADLKAGRSEFKEGADITRPRGQPEGGKQVADIGTTNVPEETARLFRPNDRGDLSVTAIKTIDRLAEVKATPADFDQVRHIVLEQLMHGDPGKVATRVENFIKNNPTAANKLFTPDQMAKMKAWAETNKKLVPDPKATNPSKSSYGIIGAAAKEGRKAAFGQGTLIGSVLGGWPGAVVGGAVSAVSGAVSKAKEGKAAREALKPVDRSSVSQFALKGAAGASARSTPGATQAAQTMTIDIPGDPNEGEQVRILERSDKGAYRVRLRNGEERIIGDKALR